jgi:hypothetical protein
MVAEFADVGNPHPVAVFDAALAGAADGPEGQRQNEGGERSGQDRGQRGAGAARRLAGWWKGRIARGKSGRVAVMAVIWPSRSRACGRSSSAAVISRWV